MGDGSGSAFSSGRSRLTSAIKTEARDAMKYKVLRSVTGAINGRSWPAVGETLDLPDGSGDGMVESGLLEEVKDKPTPRKTTPRRGAKGKPETRPAAEADVETRKGQD